jgi:hypothetical protein
MKEESMGLRMLVGPHKVLKPAISSLSTTIMLVEA